MKKFFVVFLVGFFLIGCSEKAPMLNKNGIEEQALVDSKTIQLTQGKEILAFVVVTYLNLVDKKYRNDDLDKFVVGIYATQKYSDTAEKIKFTLHNNVLKPVESATDYAFIRDNNETSDLETENTDLIAKSAETAVQVLDVNDTRLQVIPSSNVWNKYFLISTKKELAKTITLSFDSLGGEFGTKKVTFKKRYF